MTTTRTLPAAFRRFRRLRRSQALRDLVRETRLSPQGFVYPLFVTHGEGVRREIESMPGQYQLSLDMLDAEAEELRSLGIPAVLLFGLPASKDDAGSEAYDPDGIVQRAIRTLKQAAPDLAVITDVCLCEYTSHGHCGVVVDGEVDNDKTLPLLARTAVSHARAGADIVAPSDMMDGRVAVVRLALVAAAGVFAVFVGGVLVADDGSTVRCLGCLGVRPGPQAGGFGRWLQFGRDAISGVAAVSIAVLLIAAWRTDAPVRRSAIASEAPRLMAVVVFPTPPF
ncbi:hypothetical protein LCGC14_2860510 [marine sediment metagenome]|uniref:porphobilinogen synthase n=1 Tax=marine sediment metagenome TaxID=412755 RepID=A0A0F9AE40_9ZZZZ